MDPDLLSAAADIVSRGESLTMDTLAERTGISRSTAYRRTGGRAALLEALADQGLEEASTRSRILDAVRGFVALEGVVRVSIEAIAAEAGVSPVTVYRLFGDRRSLLRAALAEVFPTEPLAALRALDLPLPDALELLAVRLIRFAGTYPGLVSLITAPASADRAELMELHGQQSDVRDQLTAGFGRLAEAGLLPPGDALLRAGSFVGLCLGASLLMHEVRPLTEQEVPERARHAVRTFLHGLLGPEPPGVDHD